MNAKLNRGTCAPARRRGKIRKERDEEPEKEEQEEEEYRQLCIAEFGDRYPEYAFRRRNYRGRWRRRAGNPLVYVSESSGPRGSGYNVTREIRVPATDFLRRRQSEKRRRSGRRGEAGGGRGTRMARTGETEGAERTRLNLFA